MTYNFGRIAKNPQEPLFNELWHKKENFSIYVLWTFIKKDIFH